MLILMMAVAHVVHRCTHTLFPFLNSRVFTIVREEGGCDGGPVVQVRT